MHPSQPQRTEAPTIGAPKPKSRVIIIKNTTDEVEKLMNDGWQMTACLPHTAGALVILQKL